MMSKIVRTVADVAFPLIIVFGLYIILHGHVTPGGGFQGGAIIASGFAMYAISHKKRDLIISTNNILPILEGLGLLFFLIIAFAGLIHSFFYNILSNGGFLFGESVSSGINNGVLNSGGVIPLMNLAVGVEVSAGLAVIILHFTLASDTDKRRQ